MTDTSNPDGIGRGGPSGAPVVNQAPARPEDRASSGGVAPREAAPIDPGSQQAQPPVTSGDGARAGATTVTNDQGGQPNQGALGGTPRQNVAGVQGDQANAAGINQQQDRANSAQFGSQNDGGQLAAAAAAAQRNASDQTGAQPQQPPQPTAAAQQGTQTVTQGAGAAQNLPDQQQAGQTQGAQGQGAQGQGTQGQGTQGQGVQTQPQAGAATGTPGGQGPVLALLRLLALKLIVDNGGQMPDLQGLEGDVQRALDHTQAHAGRMGVIGTGARPPEEELPKTMATLLAYGLVATVGQQPNLDQYQQGVEALIRWAHGLQ